MSFIGGMKDKITEISRKNVLHPVYEKQNCKAIKKKYPSTFKKVSQVLWINEDKAYPID
jgi:hypothetical protein